MADFSLDYDSDLDIECLQKNLLDQYIVGAEQDQCDDGIN